MNAPDGQAPLREDGPGVAAGVEGVAAAMVGAEGATEGTTSQATQNLPGAGTKNKSTPLRDRSPEVYRDLLHRYEEAVKQVLQHRIYKMSDDAFEPFRQIAEELFRANATARDALELHYQTLRRMAPAPDAPRAQAYLEVGRTTIIGLMGDLLSCYRDACGNNATESKTYSEGERLEEQWPGHEP